MIHNNQLPIRILGYPQSSVTQEILWAISIYGGAGNTKDDVEILDPADFLNMSNRRIYQYAIAFNRDPILRSKVIDIILQENLGLPGIVHPTAFVVDQDFESYIGRGTFIAPYSSLMNHCKIGNFCIIENYSMISHYTTVGDNVHMHPGSMIAGKSKIGNNVTLNFRSTVLNNVTICDNVEIGAASTVTKDILVPGRYVGTPVRRVSDCLHPIVGN